MAAVLWLLDPGRGPAGSGTVKASGIRHVILISIDTCRADYLSCYGYGQRTTPNIDALAEKGVDFSLAVEKVWERREGFVELNPACEVPVLVEADGTVSVANFTEGGITSISADGERVEHLPLPDPQTTNICFGGDNLKTAYITLAGHGKLIAIDWPRPGLPLNFLNLAE